MGPFRWVATFWTPAIDYRDYPANEVEDIAWEATTIGSRRGFVVGVLTGALVSGLLIVGVVLTGLYRPAVPSTAPRPGPPDAPAAQAVRQELAMLREENNALKKQVMDATAAATCPPCQPQAVGTVQPQGHAIAPLPPPAKRALTGDPAQRKASGSVPGDQAAPPIPSNCRQAADCS
jgi:hypothetical protein